MDLVAVTGVIVTPEPDGFVHPAAPSVSEKVSSCGTLSGSDARTGSSGGVS